MPPETIIQVLESRGWTAEAVQAADVTDLVDVEEGALLKCVDGRLSDHPGMRGPKALGGVYAIASLRGVGDADGLKSIAAEVRAAGYTPSVHGDELATPAPMGCGYFALWRDGALEGLEPPSLTAEQGRDAVLAAGGAYETLAGVHAESEVMINLVPRTTLEPNADQRFVVDAWVAAEFDLDVGRYLGLAAQTVELLGGP
ncbi:MAG: cadmium-containing carbonic anhydrase, partial [Planctomycetota bacterium]